MHSVSLFMAAQKLRAASDELAESQVSAKGPNYYYFYAAGTCPGLRFCLATSQASSRLFKAGKPILDEERILPFRPDTYFAKCFLPLLLLRHLADER
jgi:hypothetical protein